MSDDRHKRPRSYTIDPDKMEDFIATLDTDQLTDPQKCGHILEFFKQHKIIKNVALNPADMYHRDANAATTKGGGSIDMSGGERRQ
jgi:hypothetical protein